MPALGVGVVHDVLVALAKFGLAGVILLHVGDFVQFFKAVDDAVKQSELTCNAPQPDNHAHQPCNGESIA